MCAYVPWGDRSRYPPVARHARPREEAHQVVTLPPGNPDTITIDHWLNTHNTGVKFYSGTVKIGDTCCAFCFMEGIVSRPEHNTIRPRQTRCWPRHYNLWSVYTVLASPYSRRRHLGPDGPDPQLQHTLLLTTTFPETNLVQELTSAEARQYSILPGDEYDPLSCHGPRYS